MFHWKITWLSKNIYFVISMYCISESSHIIIEYGVFFTFTLDRTQITAQFLKRAMKFLQQTSVWSCFFTRAVSSVSVVFRVCLSDLSDRFEGFDKLSKEWHSLGGGEKKQDWASVDGTFLRATLHVCGRVSLHRDSMMNDSTLSALDNVKTLVHEHQLPRRNGNRDGPSLWRRRRRSWITRLLTVDLWHTCSKVGHNLGHLKNKTLKIAKYWTHSYHRRI